MTTTSDDERAVESDADRAARRYYDDFAAGYERERGRGYHALLDDREIAIVTPYATGRDVLEVGCGTGLLLGRLAAMSRRATGVDLSPGMLAQAKARGLDVREGSATSLPFDDASFDLVCSFKVLAHVPDIGTALAEMARVTRRGGTIAAELYNPLSLRYVAKRLAGPRPISDGRTEADVYTRWDPPWAIARLLPPSLDLVHVHGVRIATPAAFLHRVAAVDRALRRAEDLLAATPARYLGGFLVAIATRR